MIWFWLAFSNSVYTPYAMKKILLLTMLFFLSLGLKAQDVTQNLSRHQADSLLKSLKTKIPENTRIDILLKLAQFNILKPGSFKPDLDSATRYVDQAEHLNTLIKPLDYSGYLWLVKAYLAREKGNQHSGLTAVKKAIEILKSSTDWYHLGEAYFEIIQYDYYDNPDLFTQKIHLTEQAVQAFQQSGHIEIYAYTLKFLADLYTLNYETGKGLRTLQLSLAAYKSIHYKLLQGVYDVLGQVYHTQKDFTKALNYELIALKTARQNDDTTMQLCEIYNHLGLTCSEMHEYPQALIYFKGALTIAEKYNDAGTIYFLANNISNTDLWLKKYHDALNLLNKINGKYTMPNDNFSNSVNDFAYLSVYTATKELKKAQLYCNRLLIMINTQPLEGALKMMIFGHLIKFYINSGQYALAKHYLKLNKILTQNIGNPLAIANNLKLQFSLDTAQRNFQAATYDLIKYDKINDSLFNETKSNQIKQTEIEYETEQKDDQLKLQDRDIRILNQKNELQQDKLKQAERLRNETFAGIFALLIAGALFYRQYRQKQKANSIITRQNADITRKNLLLEHLLKEKEWLLKEVHHRVKNNLHTVICLLESQAAYLENDALKAIENSQHRIYAMSLIHQKLYQSEDIKNIDMDVYIPELIHYLKDAFESRTHIRFQLDIEKIKLGVSQAIPISIVINEAVTNSLKYAFPGSQNGTISITMQQKGNEIILIIHDDGIGINLSPLETPSESLGLKLIKGLSEDIHAVLAIENHLGTKITLVFGVDPLNNGDNSLATTVSPSEYA